MESKENRHHEGIDRLWTGKGAAVMPGNPYYSEPFDMDGNTRLRVAARLLEVPPHPAALAVVCVQGTDDGKAERKNWVVEGNEVALSPGAWECWTLHDVRQQVRVVADPHTPDGLSRIEIRLTRLP